MERDAKLSLKDDEVVKKLSALLRGITSKHHGGLNCLHSFARENKLESHKKGFESKDFFIVIMPS